LDYGEVIGKESDMEHMADVEESMLRMRSSMSSLIKSKDTNTVIMNRITLGTTGNPYLTVARSSGVLTHNSHPSSFHLELVVVESDGAERILNAINGEMAYISNNYYFHDQTYYFTAGGVVLGQYGSEVMSSYPDITVVPTDTGYSIQLYLYGMASDYFKISGIDSLALKIKMAGYSEIEEDLDAGDVLSIRVNGVGEEAWHDYLKGYLTEIGLVEGEGLDFQISAPTDWDDPAQELEIDLTGIEAVYAVMGDMEVNL
ncbi:MAG: hypothetical protein U9R75_01840, partial [Candidatus Thermoplasmatota archaeon]|nr:hypothetical protein [Candidatus Thermoplasmatota archaeon]